MGINSIKNIKFCFFLNSGKKIHNKIVKFGGENFEHLGCFKNFEVEILKKKIGPVRIKLPYFCERITTTIKCELNTFQK